MRGVAADAAVLRNLGFFVGEPVATCAMDTFMDAVAPAGRLVTVCTEGVVLDTGISDKKLAVLIVVGVVTGIAFNQGVGGKFDVFHRKCCCGLKFICLEPVFYGDRMISGKAYTQVGFK